MGGIYTVIGTNANGCSASATVEITEDKATPTVTVTPTTAILTCLTPSTTITASGATSYAWSSPAGFTATTATADILVGGIYTVIGTNANGCSASATVEITEDKATPTVTVTPTTAILTCLTPSTTITASGATSYAWSGTGGFTATTATADILVGGIYTVIGTNANGCSASATVEITEDKTTPTVTVTPTTAILTCLTPSTTITASGATSYAWSSPAGFTATTATADILVGGIYTVIGTNANGCTASATVEITEDKTTPTVTVTGSDTLCDNSTISLVAMGGDTYLWSGPNAFTSTSASVSIPNATVTNSGTYTVTVTSSTGCTANATAVILINPTVAAPTVQADVTIALGASVTLTATGCSGTLLWFKSADSTAVTMPVSPTVTTSYFARCEQTANGITCSSVNSADVKVKVSTGFVISIKSGDWEDPTTWDSGSVPTATDDVTIDSTHTVSITTNGATAKKLNFNANSTLNYANSTAKLTVKGL
ncbi:MAG: hypothetical protein U5N85_01480 [Arcicella sp.]|nr:hypothetical protein [Arcicella sp.]